MGRGEPRHRDREVERDRERQKEIERARERKRVRERALLMCVKDSELCQCVGVRVVS